MKKIVVVGSGLTGLWISHRLSEAGNEVILVESREVAGGRYRRAREASPFETPDLSFFPGDERHEQLLQTLRNDSPDLFQGEIASHQSLTHNHGEWRDFVGFGDDEASSVSLLSQFNVGQELEFSPKPAHLVESLLRETGYDLRTRMEVTHFEVQDGKVVSVTVNGSTEITADEFVFCPSPLQLLELIPGEGLKPATRSRLARASGWTAVFLKLDYSEELSDNRGLRFLLGTGKEFEPAVGRIFEDHSKWMSLVPSEKAMEPDIVTGQIRAIKRVLKRHCPELLEKSTREHIYIQEDAYGDIDLKLKHQGRFNEISNLWLANHRMSPLLGAMAELDSAQSVLSQLLVADTQSAVLTDQQL